MNTELDMLPRAIVLLGLVRKVTRDKVNNISVEKQPAFYVWGRGRRGGMIAEDTCKEAKNGGGPREVALHFLRRRKHPTRQNTEHKWGIVDVAMPLHQSCQSRFHIETSRYLGGFAIEQCAHQASTHLERGQILWKTDGSHALHALQAVPHVVFDSQELQQTMVFLVSQHEVLHGLRLAIA